MAEIYFVSGGCRSGKSSYSEQLALTFEGPHIYVATSPRIDDDMNDRIARHQKDRAGKGWKTIEEELWISAISPEFGSYDTDRLSDFVDK